MEAISNASAGDVIKFGPYEWLVLQKEGSKALIITADSIEEGIKYNEVFDRTSWETCSLRAWMNGEFLERFSAEEQACILDSESGDMYNTKFEMDGGNPTVDKIFCFSAIEAKELMTEEQRKASVNWWLRTPGYVSMHAVCVFADFGGVFLDGWKVHNGRNMAIRPAMWVSC